MEIYGLIKKIRKDLCLSQKDFANAIHLSFSTINRWENGHARPNRLALVTIRTLAKEHKVSDSLIASLDTLINDNAKE